MKPLSRPRRPVALELQTTLNSERTLAVSDEARSRRDQAAEGQVPEPPIRSTTTKMGRGRGSPPSSLWPATMTATRSMTISRLDEASTVPPRGTTANDAAATEWDTLATTLNQWGVLHVAPAHARVTGMPRSPRDLFTRLALATEPRLRQAAVALLLTHPHLAADARAAITDLPGDRREQAMRRYVAAAALQRMARTRIEERLGPLPLIPPAYLETLGLPSLDAEFGRATLFALAQDEQARHGYDAWGTYLTLLDLFLAEIRRRDWGVMCDSEPTARG